MRWLSAILPQTSPILYLHRLGHLDLLQELYEYILVPGAVVEELRAGKEQGEDVPDIADYNRTQVRSLDFVQFWYSFGTQLALGLMGAVAQIQF